MTDLLMHIFILDHLFIVGNSFVFFARNIQKAQKVVSQL